MMGNFEYQMAQNHRKLQITNESIARFGIKSALTTHELITYLVLRYLKVAELELEYILVETITIVHNQIFWFTSPYTDRIQ